MRDNHQNIISFSSKQQWYDMFEFNAGFNMIFLLPFESFTLHFLLLNVFGRFFLTFLVIKTGACNIISPENPIISHVGDEALFNWTTDDGRIIYSANWGIKNENHPDSQFINTNVFTTVVNYNENMDPKYRPRVYFVGNLKMGHAWFKLKNVSLNDDLKYVANIRESKGGVLAYIVQLKVKKKANITWTTQVASTHVTDATATSIMINDSFDATSFSPKRDSFNTTSSPNREYDHHYAGLLIAVLLLPLMWSFLVLISLKTKTKNDKYSACYTVTL